MATLTTWMNNARVGTLTRQANGAHSFRYDEEWLRSPRARPLSLSLPLQYGNITADAVYHYFDNLLPDSPQVRERIVRRYQARSKQPFDLLAEVGRDSVGAVTLLPPGEEAHLAALRWQTLDEAQLTALLTAYQSDIPLGMVTGQDDFRISVAGAQEKTALLRMGEHWCIPQGTTPTTHIIKLPIGEIKQPNATLDLRESVDNEYLCLALARALGLAVPEAEIINTPRIRALAVTRFDRRWAQEGRVLLRLPQIYWPFARDAARYDVLANWWAEVVKPTHTRLYIGVALYKVGEPSKNEPDWTVDGGVPELKKQLDLNESLPQIQGTILFRENNLNQPQTRQAVNYLRSRWGPPQS